MKTGDIWLAQLDPTIGSEIHKTRPLTDTAPATRQPATTLLVAALRDWVKYPT